jgi:hypothetical protein
VTGPEFDALRRRIRAFLFNRQEGDIRQVAWAASPEEFAAALCSVLDDLILEMVGGRN